MMGGRISPHLIELDCIGWSFRDNIELMHPATVGFFALGPKILVDIQTLDKEKSHENIEFSKHDFPMIINVSL